MIKSTELRIGGNFAHELRIGNWLTSDDNSFWKVDAEVIDVVGRRADHLYAPIPLTPEMLEKCGFKVTITEHTYGNGRVGIFFYVGLFTYGIAKGRYLHQLQNLYFALTGEELTVNL